MKKKWIKIAKLLELLKENGENITIIPINSNWFITLSVGLERKLKLTLKGNFDILAFTLKSYA